jgi:hypothetical protein
MSDRASVPPERTILVERHLRLTERRCAVCGTAFLGWGRGRFCSDRCRQRSSYAKHAEARRAKRRARYQRQKQGGAE